MTAPRTLVAHVGGIGDFILTWPVLAALAQEGPVELVGRPGRLEIARDAGLVQAVHDMDQVRFETLFTEPAPELLAFLGRFQRAVLWMRDDGTLASALARGGVQTVHAAPGVPPDGWTRHASEFFVDALGLPPQPPFSWAALAQPPRYDLVIHPGSGGAKKNWPLERFAAVADWAARQGRRVVWSLGPAETGLALPAGAERLPKMPLTTLAQELGAARVYLGNDSGVTHLAALAPRPVVAIFGPTNPGVWAPRGAHVEVVHAPAWPSVETVLARLGAICDSR